MMVPTPLPSNTVPSAAPRPTSNSLDTAADQTICFGVCEKTANTVQSAYHWMIEPEALPSSANAKPTSNTPETPDTRGPQRSTSAPASGVNTIPVSARIVSPAEICPRDQPND